MRTLGFCNLEGRCIRSLARASKSNLATAHRHLEPVIAWRGTRGGVPACKRGAFCLTDAAQETRGETTSPKCWMRCLNAGSSNRLQVLAASRLAASSLHAMPRMLPPTRVHPWEGMPHTHPPTAAPTQVHVAKACARQRREAPPRSRAAHHGRRGAPRGAAVRAVGCANGLT